MNRLPIIWTLLLAAVLFPLSGCGRLGPPLPPQAFAPAPVEDLVVIAETEGVQFQWSAPEDDRQGEQLEELSGYAVLRAEPEDMAQFLSDPTGAAETIGGVFDRQRNLLTYKRERAIEEGRPSRREEVPEALKRFQFFDETPKADTRYIYMVAGVNQGGVLGAMEQFVRVDFRGENSDIEIFTPEQLSETE